MRFPGVIVAMLANTAGLASADDRVVTTAQGRVEGVERGGAVTYLGLPYATAARWRLPEDPPTWEGVRQADKIGPACPQDGQEVMIEDCLTLNVFGPTDGPGDAGYPVLVWFHGGGLRAGRGDDTPMALTRHGIVVVTLNYRLGLLGFYDTAVWSADRPRNFAQADMVKSLEWVAANIEAFGGDPDNVTIAGHSAGGMAVQLMMVDPRARGLFHKAVSHSGYGTWPFLPVGEDTRSLSVATASFAADFSAPPEDLVARTPFFHLPYIGGPDLPRQPIDVFRRGEQAAVPYWANANSYDGYGMHDGAGYQLSDLARAYLSGPEGQRAYAEDLAVSPEQATMRLFGDIRYLFASWATVAAMQRVGEAGYLSVFTGISGKGPGARHGEHVRRLVGPEDTAIQRYFVNFIRTGNVNGADLPQWPAYDADRRPWMVFGKGASVMDDPMAEKIQFLETVDFPLPVRPLAEEVSAASGRP